MISPSRAQTQSWIQQFGRFMIGVSLLWGTLASAEDLDFGPARDQILSLAARTQILVFGEDHYLRESRILIEDVLAKGVANKTIDAYATEYSLDEIEGDFQAYLKSPTATVNSPEEKRFFMEMASRNFRWPNDQTNRDFFRFLRDLKLKYGPRIAICGIDTRPAAPPAPDREWVMAQQAARCLSRAHHALVHVGALHAFSTRASHGRTMLPSVSQSLAKMLPGRSLVTLAHLQYTPAPGSDESDPLLDAERLATKLMGGNVLRLHPVTELPPKLRALDLYGTRFDLVWDYAMTGPRGTYAPLDDLENRYGFNPEIFKAR